MIISASALRNDIYRLLDQVAEGGGALFVERKGHRLKVEREEATTKLSRLVPHDCMAVDPEEIVHMDWSEEWTGGLP
jgi:hypothetical protein